MTEYVAHRKDCPALRMEFFPSPGEWDVGDCTCDGTAWLEELQEIRNPAPWIARAEKAEAEMKKVRAILSEHDTCDAPCSVGDELFRALAAEKEKK